MPVRGGGGTQALFLFNFIKTIKEPSASTKPVTQLESNLKELLVVRFKFEYDLECKIKLKDSTLLSLVVHTFFVFTITTILDNKNIFPLCPPLPYGTRGVPVSPVSSRTARGGQGREGRHLDQSKSKSYQYYY